MNIINVDALVERVNAYATQKGLTQQEAARRLLEIGLAAESGGTYISELTDMIVRSIREELMSVKHIARAELQGVSDEIDSRLSSAESAAYAAMIAGLKGRMGEPAPVAADILAIAGSRYAAGESLETALAHARDLRASGERR